MWHFRKVNQGYRTGPGGRNHNEAFYTDMDAFSDFIGGEELRKGKIFLRVKLCEKYTELYRDTCTAVCVCTCHERNHNVMYTRNARLPQCFGQAIVQLVFNINTNLLLQVNTHLFEGKSCCI